MERRIIEGSLTQVAVETAEWLGTDVDFILNSYSDGDFQRARYFEHLGQKHATLKVTE